jgi:2-C-methyl-D-erythritol 4-phosphate cytidylyltransferase
MMKKSVLIVAAGSGSRMNHETPKQFLRLGDQPLLMHTIRRFYDFDPTISIILVLPFAYVETWNILCARHRFPIAHQLVTGGSERFYSVKNGLGKATASGLIAIHDGVRPLVTEALIKRCYDNAARHGSAIPVLKPDESLREINGNLSKPVDREKFRLVQTPQTFDAKLIKAAYHRDFQPEFTDDAAVYEAAGYAVHLVEGDAANIKITTPVDLIIAESLMSGSKT